MPAGTRATTDPGESPASIVAWGLVFWAGVLAVGLLLARSSTAAIALQAAAAEWAAGRLGIRWSVRETPAATVGRRAVLGAALGGVLGATGVAVALLSHGATLRPFAPQASPAVLGLFVAALGAVRDELFVRGLVLRATQGRLPQWAALLACGATSAAACAAANPAVSLSIAAEAFRGIVLGALWISGGGAWMPCMANASWTWVTGPLTRGGVLDVAFAGEPEASLPVLGTLVGAAAIAVVWVTRTRPSSNP